MKQRPRIYYSDQQKALMWDRWQQGDSLNDIAKLFDRGHSSVSRILAETCGFRPARRMRSPLSLTLARSPDAKRTVLDLDPSVCVIGETSSHTVGVQKSGEQVAPLFESMSSVSVH